MGNGYTLLHLLPDALAAFEQALPLFRVTHDRVATGQVLYQLGSLLMQVGRYNQAIIILEEALSIARETGDSKEQLNCLRRPGLASTEAKQFEQAISYHLEALTILRINRDRETEMYELGNLGTAYTKLGYWREAIDCQQKVLQLAHKFGNKESQALAAGNLGRTYVEILRQIGTGISFFEQALALFREAGDQYNEAKTLRNLGGIYLAEQRFSESLQVLEEARTIAVALGDRELLGNILGKIGQVYELQGQTSVAIRSQEHALLLEQELGDRQAEIEHFNSLGLLQRRSGKLMQGLDLHRKALTLALTYKDHLRSGQIHNKHAQEISPSAWAENRSRLSSKYSGGKRDLPSRFCTSFPPIFVCQRGETVENSAIVVENSTNWQEPRVHGSPDDV